MVGGRVWTVATFLYHPVVIGSVLFLLLGGQTVLAGFYFGLVNLVAERRELRQTNASKAAAADAAVTVREDNE